MIIIDESQSPSSPDERSPLKGGDQSPATPYNAAAPPPPYAAAPTAPAVPPPPVPSYQAIADQNVEQEDIESGGPWHHRGSLRGRWRGGRGRGRGRGRHGGHEGDSSPNPGRSTFRRFMRAFLVALVVIIVWGAFLDSVDMIFRTNGSRRRQGTFSGSQWLVTWYRSPTVAPRPCTCPEQSLPAMPGRVLPIQYPPVASQIVTPPTPIQTIQYSADARRKS